MKSLRCLSSLATSLFYVIVKASSFALLMDSSCIPGKARDATIQTQSDLYISVNATRLKFRKSEFSCFKNNISYRDPQIEIYTSHKTLENTSYVDNACDAAQLRLYKHVVSAAQNLLLRAYLSRDNTSMDDLGRKRRHSIVAGWYVRFQLYPRVRLLLSRLGIGDSRTCYDGSLMDQNSPAAAGGRGMWHGPFARRRHAREAVAHARALFLLDGGKRADGEAMTASSRPPSAAKAIRARRPPARPVWRSAEEQRAAATLASEVWSGAWDAAAVLHRHRVAAEAAERAAAAAAAAERAGEAGAPGAAAGGAGGLDLLAGLSDGVLRAPARVNGLREIQVLGGGDHRVVEPASLTGVSTGRMRAVRSGCSGSRARRDASKATT